MRMYAGLAGDRKTRLGDFHRHGWSTSCTNSLLRVEAVLVVKRLGSLHRNKMGHGCIEGRYISVIGSSCSLRHETYNGQVRDQEKGAGAGAWDWSYSRRLVSLNKFLDSSILIVTMNPLRWVGSGSLTKCEEDPLCKTFSCELREAQHYINS